MEEDSGITLTSLKVDGGACENNFLMQFQVNIINAPVLRPHCVETTAMGAAYLASRATGYWGTKEAIANPDPLADNFADIFDFCDVSSHIRTSQTSVLVHLARNLSNPRSRCTNENHGQIVKADVLFC